MKPNTMQLRSKFKKFVDPLIVFEICQCVLSLPVTSHSKVSFTGVLKLKSNSS